MGSGGLDGSPALSLSTVLYINRLGLVNVFAYARGSTVEYSRGRRTLERTRRVDLDVNYRSPGPDVPAGLGRGGRARSGMGRRDDVEEKKTPTVA